MLKKQCWIVGASWGGDMKNHDQYLRCIKKKQWEFGYFEDSKPFMTERFKQISPGDKIAIKKKHGRNQIQIRAIGVVTKVIKRPGKSSSGLIGVRWVEGIDEPIDLIVDGHGCYSTIHGPFPSPSGNIEGESKWLDQIFLRSGNRPFPDFEFSLPTGDMDKRQETKVRRYQQQWRAAIRRRFGDRCCISGVTNPKLLVAAHIKPYGRCEDASEKGDAFNGILLNALLDKAFECGFVRISASGKITVHDLTKREQRLMGIKKTSLHLDRRSLKYLKYRHSMKYED